MNTDKVLAQMTKADELWEKYQIESEKYSLVHPAPFLAALTEYGEAVRAEAVKVLEDNWFKTQSDCAAAIEKMKLP